MPNWLLDKKIFYSFFLFILFSFLFIPSQTFAAEKINNYVVDIKINQDSKVDITERITYDFGSNDRHGIKRFIPLSFDSSWFKQDIEISNIQVTDSQGNSRPFEIKESGDKKTVKIGDPNKIITGEHTYNISYQVDWVLGYYKDYDELYWNAIGGEWDVPTQQAEVNVKLPKKIARDKLTLKCFVGRSGSKNNCSQTSVSGENGQVASINFEENDTIAGSEAFTIVVGFPKNIVETPGTFSKIMKIVQDNWVLGGPIAIFLVMLGVWSKLGRDKQGRGNIIAQYEAPEGLTPIEVGMLIDEKINKHDISAQIIHLATKGFLDIEYKKEEGLLFDDKKFILHKKKDANEAENEFDREILNLLFGFGKDKVDLSELQANQKALRNIKKKISTKLTESGYYKYSPRKTRGLSYLAAFLIGFGLIFLSGEAIGFIGGISSGIIVAIFGYFMPAKTKEGAVLEEKIKGFKQYLSVAEKERLEFHNAPDKKPETFEKFLPFAIAFEVEDQWAQKFEDIYDQQPDWYSSHAGVYGATNIAGDMNNFDSAVSSSAIGQSASGGGVSGGSAGGGAGGGGGGSW